MLDKLAIVILGEPNSGKTHTLRAFSDYYSGKEVETFRKGWRYDIAPFKPNFWSIKIATYILPSSPTESEIPLADTIEPQDWYPELLLMAEQIDGSEYSNTIHYLMTNEYHIKEFNISNNIGDSIWDRWTDGDDFRKNAKLLQRREQIADYVRLFLKSKI